LCGEPWKFCISHLCDSEYLKVGLCEHLSEERVERDPSLCELLNEDVGFFVVPNLGIKSRVSCALLFSCITIAIYLLVEPSLC
jgi:hypothetical protein